MVNALSREILPLGRPLDTPNLTKLPRDNGESIDQARVNLGYSSLGHISHKVISPNIGLNLARDLGYYRQTEAIFNVIRENETMEQLHANNLDIDDIPCHGQNSLKDYLTSTKFESNTIAESTNSPGRIKLALLNQNSSGNFNQADTDVYQTSENPIKVMSNPNSAKNQQKLEKRRPKTGVAAGNKKRNDAQQSGGMLVSTIH